MSIRNYRDLRVWQNGMDLVEGIYRMTANFPRHVIYGLSSQMRRAAISIPSNIAEGHVKSGGREYQRHISIALGSLAELQTQIEIAGRMDYLTHEHEDHLLDQTVSLSRQLFALRNALLDQR